MAKAASNFLFLVVTVTAMNYAKSHSHITGSTFYKSCICDVEKRIAFGCSRKISPLTSNHSPVDLNWCTVQCLSDESCQGASLNEHGECFIHSTCESLPSCTSPDTNHHYMSKNCPTCQISNPLSFACPSSWNEYSAGQYVKSCKDLDNAGYPKGVYKVFLDLDEDGQNPIPAWCEVRDSKSIISVMMNKGHVDMHKTWDEYRYGFYLDDYHYWTGLESIRAILQQAGTSSTTTVFDLEIFWIDGARHWSSYSDYYDLMLLGNKDGFQVDSYSLGRAGRSPVGGNVLGKCLGLMTSFFTRDANYDGAPDKNCAESIGSGWWLADCEGQGGNSLTCRPMGRSVKYRDELPSVQIMALTGLDLEKEEDFIHYIQATIMFR